MTRTVNTGRLTLATLTGDPGLRSRVQRFVDDPGARQSARMAAEWEAQVVKSAREALAAYPSDFSGR